MYARVFFSLNLFALKFGGIKLSAEGNIISKWLSGLS